MGPVIVQSHQFDILDDENFLIAVPLLQNGRFQSGKTERRELQILVHESSRYSRSEESLADS